MAEIVNLKRVRKEKARAGKEAKADENRRRFGRSKAERAALEAEAELARRKLDAHRVDGSADEPETPA